MNNFQIIKKFNGSKIKYILFDFDGTLSHERDGWINLMIAINTETLLQSVKKMTKKEAMNFVIKDIESTIGIPTYLQMKRLTEKIYSLGGKADTISIKAVYNSALSSLVQKKYSKLRHGMIKIDSLRVKGTLNLLKELSKKFGEKSLYLASGTDIEAVKKSVQKLGLKKYFGKRIIGAGSNRNPEICAKETIITKFVKENKLAPGELLCFGDGVPELAYTKKYGGIGIGVLTPDKCNHKYTRFFTIEKKRKRLINAGANILIRDFFNATKLLEYITRK